MSNNLIYSLSTQAQPLLRSVTFEEIRQKKWIASNSHPWWPSSSWGKSNINPLWEALRNSIISNLPKVLFKLLVIVHRIVLVMVTILSLKRVGKKHYFCMAVCISKFLEAENVTVKTLTNLIYMILIHMYSIHLTLFFNYYFVLFCLPYNCMLFIVLKWNFCF